MKYLLALLCVYQSYSATSQKWISETANLKIQQLTERVFVHVTYLQSETYGKVACNGMIYMSEKEAIVFDTPSYNTDSRELINWIELQGRKVKAVVINHFHIDALGGLEAFHEAGIPSFASNMTIARTEGIKPQNGFEDEFQLMLSDSPVLNRYFGEAHTTDNIVSYLPNESVLFGGCMIKSLNAGKGNLDDANVMEWPTTVQAIKLAYPDIKWVIPGHGSCGDQSLLDYTITLFTSNK